MDRQSWDRLQSLFFAALQLPPEELTAFLDHRCADDPELRAELEAVLASHERIGGDQPLIQETTANAETTAAEATTGATAGDLTGLRIGPYRLEERIGRGGMGDVYRAQRVDESYRQEVAIKLVRSHLPPEEMAARFRIERQVLARLQHPNVAPLLDGGVTPDGRPYLVMQFVRGLPITDYADAHRLPLADRLHLFMQVCRVVHFAHSNLVVHRDLKPSNILVTEEGEIRLLDFGIAKLLDPEGMGITAPLTEEHLLLTPEHAAPEQILGDPITTATDVYALGILLYELLTGTRPFRASMGPGWHRIVCEQEATRPSEALTTLVSDAWQHDAADVARARRTRVSVLRQQLRGDLDAIVLMALRKEPERRYSSAEQFAEDVRRFLEGRPVLARRDTIGYRARKFLRRNRLVVAAAAVMLAVLVAATGFSTYQARARAVALEEARLERDKAASLASFMLSVFGANEPVVSGGDTITARQLLDRAGERIALELADEPLVRADMEMAIGQAYGALGLFAQAQPHLEAALQRRRENLSAPHEDIAEALDAVGRGIASLGDARAALPHLQEALAMREALFGPNDTTVASTLTALARIEIDLEEFTTAQRRLERAVRIYRSAEGPTGRGLPQALRFLYLTRQWQGDHEGAFPYAAAALQAADSLLSPTDPYRLHVANDYALALEGVGRLDSAEAVHRRLVTEYTALSGPDHVDISYAYHNLGRVLRKQGRTEEALAAFQQALEVRERALGPDHPAVAYILHSYALARGLAGDVDGASQLIDRAVRIAEARLGPTDIATFDALVLQSQLRALQGRSEEAIRILETLVDRGWADLAVIEATPYASISDDPRFQVVSEKVRQKVESEG